MSGRAAARSISVPLSWVDLPILSHPQYISSNGYELAAPEVDITNDGAEREEDQIVIDGQEGQAKLEQGEEAVVAVQEKENGEPLLSLADSLVLVQSLHQSRQRHLQRLLPHIFTHPPLPSHNKPRARGPPRSTFLYPTPPPLLPPLPYREYHGPRPKSQAPSANETPSAGSPKADEFKGSTARTQARAKRAAELDEIAPAHETECIARVTLSIGPFSYPETELWIGRFVEPRADAGKAIKAEQRAKMMAAGVEPIKKKVPAVPRPSAAPAAHTTKPPLTPSATVRPPASAAGPSVRPPAASSASAAPPAAKPESAINPELIRKVNLAAATRPWLSEIIHKAARKQATKEELSRLGRTVGRLNKGEDIDQEGEAVTTSARPPTTTLGLNTAGSESGVAGPSRTSSPLTSEDDSESELSDLEEVASRKGPPQVGGGPLSKRSATGDTSEAVKREPGTAGGSQSEASAAPVRSTSPRVPTPFTHFTPKPVVPQPRPPKSAIPQRPPANSTKHSAPPTSRPPQPVVNTSSNPANPVNEASTPASAIMPPPPVRPIYPSVPPFLFIAFKDAPTEKFLLPLGANSIVTRIGGDHVTHPPPVSVPVAPVSAVAALTVPSPSAPVPVAVDLPPTAAEKAKLRTRASLGRGSKDTAAVPTEVKATTAPAEPEPEPVDSMSISKIIKPKRTEKPGTVVVSMIMPLEEWEKPDWDELEKGLPWIHTVSKGAPAAPAASIPMPVDPAPVAEGVDKGSDASPRAVVAEPIAHTPAAAPKVRPPMLNLGAVDFAPKEGGLKPVTVRLDGMDDLAWIRVKQVLDIVERAEVDLLLREEAGLVRSKCVEAEAPAPSSASSPPGKSLNTQPPIVPVAPTSSALIRTARSIYLNRKQSRFTRLLQRTPARSFLRLRTETVDPALIESTSDKWAPRTYPISTKPLYTRSPPSEDYNDPLPFAHYPSPEKAGNKRKKGEDTGVTFEMPVSLDKLDEMVEEGAKFAVGKKGAKRVRVRAEKGEEDGRKKRRSIAGAICQGCGLPGLKVWRKGPGGKGTLCKDCGDAFAAGTLGELKAPGAGKKSAVAIDVEGEELMVKDVGDAELVAELEPVKSATPPPGSFGNADEEGVPPAPTGPAMVVEEPSGPPSVSQQASAIEAAGDSAVMDVD